MDTTTYWIMILAPFVYWILKISLSWRIYQDALRQKHSKTYIKSHKGNFIRSYFAWNFRKELKAILFISNLLMGIILLISLPTAVIYLVLYICKYSLKYSIVGTVNSYLIMTLWTIHFTLQIVDKLSETKKKK